MILSASRRTDIPAFYTEWFINKIRAGELLIRNPLFYHQVSKVELSPKVIECIIFWTRNAEPLIPYLKELDELGYKYYFQYTITGYSKEWETYNPTIKKKIETFRQLSKQIGKDKVIWRYDPIFLNKKDLSVDFHINQFEMIASQLYQYTTRCVISFLDVYKKIEKKISEYQIYSPLDNEYELNILLTKISSISNKYNLSLETCSEDKELLKYGIKHGKCIDDSLIEKITNKKFKESKKDPNQRACCGCIESIDIGTYNTCMHGCHYCYATYNTSQTYKNYKEHSVNSLLLSGELTDKDKISVKTMRSLLEERYIESLF